MNGIVIGRRCQYCSQFRAKFRTMTAAGGNMVMCDVCYDRHTAELFRLANEIPAGCQECLLTFDELKARELSAGKGNLRMVVVWKDRRYQILCGTCSDAYLPKRVDLFKDTQFGRETLNM